MILDTDEDNLRPLDDSGQQEQGDDDGGEAEDLGGMVTELQDLQLSRLSLNGFDGACTLKLFTRVGAYKLLTMVDSGVSHCFIAERKAQELQLSMDPVAEFSVILSDGTRLQSRGLCHALDVAVADHVFSLTCFVLPLYSVDMIMGVSWLAQLGDVTANRANLSMEFMIEG